MHSLLYPNIQRILMTADTVGGVWTYALDLAEALAPYGVEVSLATMGNLLSPHQRDAVRRLGNVEVFESTFALEWMENPWKDVHAAGEWLMQLEEQIRPDLIHLNNYAHGAWPWNAPVLMAGHSCVYSWYESVRGLSPPSSWKPYHAAVSRGLRSADAVTAPTHSMLEALRHHYGYFFTLGPIPNGRKWSTTPPRTKEPLILMVGRLWDEAKNIAALDRAADRIDWPVFAAGERQHPNGGCAEYSRLHLVGYLDGEHLGEWMSRASLFVLPARYEPFGLSALEAALSGCALVLGDIPSLREVWGKAALYVPPDDPDVLAQTVNDLVRDRQLRELYAYRALTRALHFTPQRMAQDYLAAYRYIRHERQAQSCRKVM